MALRFLNSGYFAGSVGIGTDSPDQQLEILYPSYINKDTVEGLLRLTGQSNTENAGDIFSAGVGIEFYNKWTGGLPYSIGRISARASQSYDGGLQFDVAQNSAPGQSNFITAMTILDTGNVGIGTTSPAGRLHVSDTATLTAVYQKFTNGTTGHTSNDGTTLGIDSDGDFLINNNEAKEIKLYTSDTQRLTISSAGAVKFNTYNTSNNTGTPTYLLGTDASGNIVKTNTIPGSAAGPYLPLAGGTMTGSTVHNDNVKSIYGTASDGLEIYHDGTDSIIADTGTGNLYIRGAASMRLQGINQSNFLIASQGGNVNLYYNNANKFNTSNTGVNITGEIALNDKALLSNQENTDVDTGAEVVAQVSTSTYTAAFFDFVIKKTTNVRSGTVYACHDGTNVEFTETSTNDLGDTSDVTLSVDISGTNMRLLATVTSDDWSVKSLIRAI
jgi:hypothetical protein